MPHKKSIPRSLHRARYEVGITFSLNLTPSLSPKKSLVKTTNPESDVPAPVSESFPKSSLNYHSSAAADLTPSKSLMSPTHRTSVDADSSSTDSPPLSIQVQDDEDEFIPDHLASPVQVARQVEDDDLLITGYSLTTSIKTVSSITLMRRIQSRTPRIYRTVSQSSLSSLRSKDTEKPVKKRRIAKVSAFLGECIWCGTRKTAQWRKGPLGARSLCNRCGIEWAKHIKVEAKELSVSTWDAEDLLIQQYKNGERFQQFRKFPGSPSTSMSTSEVCNA